LTVTGNLSVTGTTSLTSPLPAASGGTGQSSYTAGDLLYASGTTALSKLGVGTANQVLTSSGTAPQWSSGLTLTTLTTSSTVTLNAGTASGVAYLNGSKVLTTGTALTFDGTGVQRITATAGAFQLYKDSTPTKAARFALNTVATDAAELSAYNGSAWADSFYVSPSNFAAWVLNSVERMRLDSSGNLGVGTSSPAQIIDAVRTHNAGTGITVRNANTGASAITQFIAVADTATGRFSVFSSGAGAGLANAVAIEQSTNNPILFYTNSTEKVRISGGGDVGIGTSSPAAKLDVTGAQNSVQARFGNAAGRGLTIGTSLISGTNDAGVVFNAPTAIDGTLIFQTGGNERARIDSDGNLLVGTTSQFATDCKFTVKNATVATPTGAFWNATTTGDATFVGFSTEASPNTRGSVTYNRAGGLVAYNTTSDYRAKDILGPVADPGDVIDSLKVYTGKMKGATVERPMLVAHETQAVAPYAVTGEKDAVNEDGTPKFQQMDVSSLVPLLIAEIQTLRARVAALEAQ
jgi:hypothetical protein